MNFPGVDDQHAQLPDAAGCGVGNSNSSVEINSVFSGGGEMGAFMRALDWSQTAIGTVSNWPQSLKTAVRIILASRFAMFVWWGRDLVNLYNDSYRPLLGKKHPAALGKPAREVGEKFGIKSDLEPMQFSNVANQLTTTHCYCYRSATDTLKKHISHSLTAHFRMTKARLAASYVP